jgi:hypothetical protein
MPARSGKSVTTRRIERLVFADGSFVEGTITQFAPSREQPLGIDYRLAYIAKDGTVLVLYDNRAVTTHIGTSRVGVIPTTSAGPIAWWMTA